MTSALAAFSCSLHNSVSGESAMNVFGKVDVDSALFFFSYNEREVVWM
jgi:hypothetical protein